MRWKCFNEPAAQYKNTLDLKGNHWKNDDNPLWYWRHFLVTVSVCPCLAAFPFGKSKTTGVCLVRLFQCRQKRHSLNVLSWQHLIAAVQSHYIWIGRPCVLSVMTLHTGFPINSGLTTVITFCPSPMAVKHIFFQNLPQAFFVLDSLDIVR